MKAINTYNEIVVEAIVEDGALYSKIDDATWHKEFDRLVHVGNEEEARKVAQRIADLIDIPLDVLRVVDFDLMKELNVA